MSLDRDVYQPISNTKLTRGWNIVSLTSEFIEKSFYDFEGSCNFEKVYFFDLGSQKWDLIESGMVIYDGSEVLGHANAVKVTDDCTMGQVI